MPILILKIPKFIVCKMYIPTIEVMSNCENSSWMLIIFNAVAECVLYSDLSGNQAECTQLCRDQCQCRPGLNTGQLLPWYLVLASALLHSWSWVDTNTLKYFFLNQNLIFVIFWKVKSSNCNVLELVSGFCFSISLEMKTIGYQCHF